MADPDPRPTIAPQSPAARLETEVVRHAPGWDGTSVGDAGLALAAEAAFAATSPQDADIYELTVVLTSDEEVRDLNRAWRGKDAATNVLSFPAGEQAVSPRPLGDVVIALETAQRDADAQGLALSDHVSHLVVHGVLHLLGFDHTNDEEAELMETIEGRVLVSLGIADPYGAEAQARFAEVAS